MREASVIVDKTRSAYPAYAIELDSAPFVKALETGKPFWPPYMPEIDGVVLCYDASRRGNELGSFNHIAKLSGQFGSFEPVNLGDLCCDCYSRLCRAALPDHLGSLQK
jgi:hypothetical protein